MTEKECSVCGKVKSVLHFYKKRDGLQPKCKRCTQEYNRAYYARTREQQLEQKREYYVENREACIEKAITWAEDNPEKRSRMSALQNAKAKARDRGVDVNDFDFDDWRETLEAFGHRCGYCGSTDRLTMDHFVPISGGGPNTIGNVVVACVSCNSRKNNTAPAAWIQENFSRDKLDEVQRVLYSLKKARLW